LDARALHSLAVSWVLALVVLGALAGAGCWFTIRSFKESDDSRLLLAVSRQHMLSQRVALLAHQYVATEDPYVRLDLRWELNASADELLDILERHLNPERPVLRRRPHGRTEPSTPLSDRPMSAALYAMYQEPPALLKDRLIELAGLIRQLITQQPADAAGEPALAGSVQAHANALLPLMDGLVDQLQQEHAAGLEAQTALQVRILAGTLATLLVMGVLLAWPGLKQARAALSSPRSPVDREDSSSV